MVIETLGSVSKIQTKLYQVHVKDKCDITSDFEAFGVPEISKYFYNLACDVLHVPEEFAENEEVPGIEFRSVASGTIKITRLFSTS